MRTGSKGKVVGRMVGLVGYYIVGALDWFLWWRWLLPPFGIDLWAAAWWLTVVVAVVET